MTTKKSLSGWLTGVPIRVSGEASALDGALRALCAARGAEPRWLAEDASDPAEVELVLLGGQAALDLEGALAAVAATERAIERARSADAAVLLVTSTEVLGARRGSLFESHPTRPPCPRAPGVAEKHWDLDAELAAARTELAHADARASHADATARAERDARDELLANKEPARGSALAQRAADKRAEARAAARADAASTRARAWGFVTARGWAHALCEQRLAAAGVPFTVVRVPTLGAATAGDVEGASTALAAWRRAAGERPLREPARPEDELLLVPVDAAAGAVLVACCHLLAGDAPPLFFAAFAAAPLTIGRAADLIDLAARRERGRGTRGLRARLEDAARLAGHTFTAERPPLEPELQVLSGEQRLRAQQVERSQRRLLDEPALFAPRAHDWRRYLLDTHLPAALRAADGEPAPEAPLLSYDDLSAMLAECASRYRSRPALTHLVGDERRDLSYRELLARAQAVARRLDERGVKAGDRVYLSGRNGPDWVVCFFGVAWSGAACVPLDPALTAEQVRVVHKKARGALWITDDSAKGAREVLEEDALSADAWELALAATSGPGREAEPDTKPDDVVSVLFTSGTTGDPKGVELTHKNFTSLIASLGRVFDMHNDDRLLSVLPLHHTFEFSCGLLLPLAAGAQIHYLDELTGERLLYALKEGRVTGMVGVPALWQLLERRIRKRVDDAPPALRAAFDLGLSANRALARRTGRDAGRLLFKTIHDELGGHLRTVISGGAALPEEVHQLFHGIGLPIAEGYGLTEAAPVLTVADGRAGEDHGSVGRAVPGVEVRIGEPDEHGVGEVLARGPNVMRGYFENETATRAALDDDGWLHTGDLGRLDDDGRLTIVGRQKDVVVTASGENVYLDDVEARLGDVAGVERLTLVGTPDARGGEKLALVWVGEDKGERALADELAKLPPVFRPQVVRRYDEPELPETATRKVKRKAVAAWLTDALSRAAAAAPDDDDAPLAAVRAAIARAAGLSPTEVAASTDLYADLGYDSLMWVELQGALEPLVSGLDAEQLARCRTAREVEVYVRSVQARGAGRGATPAAEKADDDEERLPIPGFAWAPARAALKTAQRELYRSLYDTEVLGRANIPQNRASIVVANHTSHLDTGLVKFALGRYGEGLRPLAARDYFFRGNRLKVAFFENLTNLVPIDRETGSGRAFEQARDVVEQGHVVLIFPEGTRRTDGTLGDFKPLVGRLSLVTGAPVLPLFLAGAYEAFPKGASVPKPGALSVRIGPPLESEELQRLTARLPAVRAARAATALIREAVATLGQGAALELSRIEEIDDAGGILRGEARRAIEQRA